MSESPEGLDYVLVNGRVWYRTYVPDLGERWTRYVKGDHRTWEQILRSGTVYPLTVGPPLNWDA